MGYCYTLLKIFKKKHLTILDILYQTSCKLQSWSWSCKLILMLVLRSRSWSCNKTLSRVLQANNYKLFLWLLYVWILKHRKINGSTLFNFLKYYASRENSVISKKKLARPRSDLTVSNDFNTPRISSSFRFHSTNMVATFNVTKKNALICLGLDRWCCNTLYSFSKCGDFVVGSSLLAYQINYILPIFDCMELDIVFGVLFVSKTVFFSILLWASLAFHLLLAISLWLVPG